jgi:hypothetical protein
MKLIVLVIIAIIGGLFAGSARLLVWTGLNLVGIGSLFPTLAERNQQVSADLQIKKNESVPFKFSLPAFHVIRSGRIENNAE